MWRYREFYHILAKWPRLRPRSATTAQGIPTKLAVGRDIHVEASCARGIRNRGRTARAPGRCQLTGPRTPIGTMVGKRGSSARQVTFIFLTPARMQARAPAVGTGGYYSDVPAARGPARPPNGRGVCPARERKVPYWPGRQTAYGTAGRAIMGTQVANKGPRRETAPVN